MNLIKKTMPFLVMAIIVGLVFFCGDAMADGIFSSATKKAAEAFESTKKIIFIVGGFGLIVIALAAIFGKMKWSTFVFLLIGLAIVAAAGAIVEYAAGAKPDSISDTFK